MNIPEAKRIENETEVLAGIKAQADLSLAYVLAIVNQLVTDKVLAKSINDTVTAKFTAQKTAFTKAVADEFAEIDGGDELTADLTV